MEGVCPFCVNSNMKSLLQTLTIDQICLVFWSFFQTTSSYVRNLDSLLPATKSYKLQAGTTVVQKGLFDQYVRVNRSFFVFDISFDMGSVRLEFNWLLLCFVISDIVTNHFLNARSYARERARTYILLRDFQSRISDSFSTLLRIWRDEVRYRVIAAVLGLWSKNQKK